MVLNLYTNGRTSYICHVGIAKKICCSLKPPVARLAGIWKLLPHYEPLPKIKNSLLVVTLLPCCIRRQENITQNLRKTVMRALHYASWGSKNLKADQLLQEWER